MDNTPKKLLSLTPAPPPGTPAMTDSWQLILGIAQAAQIAPEQSRAAPRSIPFTLITGFLGAGKTTLVNRLLTDLHGVNLVVLVNDFGAINVDASLIRKQDAETLSLTNGCACCSIAGGLSRTLLDLTERDDPPDAILLEASGVAEPNSLAHIALSNSALRLDGIVAVLDAETVKGHTEDERYGATVLRQISAADVAILNKRDLVSDAFAVALKSWLGNVVPRCRVVEAVDAEVPADVIFGLGLATPGPHAFEVSANSSHHENGFQSWSFTFDRPFDSRKLIASIPELPQSVIRAKGLVWLSDDPGHPHVFQLVGDRWTLEKGESLSTSDAPKHSTLVLIGIQDSADETELREQLLQCCVEPE